MKILILINDAPYGTEKAYNALRLANQLGKDHSNVELRISFWQMRPGVQLLTNQLQIVTTTSRGCSNSQSTKVLK
jgi:sulfur relay (sulfurtransferase) complex TusBCD TusD component (DsrE family)